VIKPMDTEPNVGKRTYSVAEIQEILGICRRKAYELCNSDAFKVIRVGRTLRVSKSSFDYWLDHYEQIGG
jgi:excisionase family DNA binding protein